MEGFKIKCTKCGADDTEVFESTIRLNSKIIGFDISFHCVECQWEEVFNEVRYPLEKEIKMKINKIIVNELPKNCNSCTLHEDEYCKIKGNVTSSEWIDLHSDSRDSRCPLEV